MAQSSFAHGAAQDIEYAIYTFYPSLHDKSDYGGWEKKQTTSNMDEALREAEALYNTKQYQKIEVKKRFFDPKNKRNIDMTLRVFENSAQAPISLATGLVFLMGFAVLCLAYFLGQSF